MIDIAENTRDSWCTPQWLCDLLPLVDLDPCSNPRSRVRARRHIMLESTIMVPLSSGPDGEIVSGDGLGAVWEGSIFINPPYSNIKPWAEMLGYWVGRKRVAGAGVLVNADSSTRWWASLVDELPLRFDFNKRIQFEPPPGVKASTNSKPQALLMTESFWRECDDGLERHGVLWRRA